jgi:hypothetical protein
MAEETIMRLDDGSNQVDFSPGKGYERPGRRRRSVHETLNVSTFVYEWGSNDRDEIPVDAMPKTDADRINTWWDNMIVLNFYRDYLNYPAESVAVRMLNEGRPLQMQEPFWDNLYEGTLILQQVTV